MWVCLIKEKKFFYQNLERTLSFNLNLWLQKFCHITNDVKRTLSFNLNLWLQKFCHITNDVKMMSKVQPTAGYWDHVYFVHPLTDISVVISTDTRPMYWSTYMYRLSVNWYVGQHISQVSVALSTDTSPRCVSQLINRHIGWARVDMCRPTLDRYVRRYVDREWLSDCRPKCQSIGYWHSADTSLLLAYWWLKLASQT